MAGGSGAGAFINRRPADIALFSSDRHKSRRFFGARTPCWATMSISARSTSLAMRLASPQT